MLDPPFKIGDKVRLRNGSSPIQVLEVDYFLCASPDTCPRWFKRKWHNGRRPRAGWYIRFIYFSSLHYKEDASRSWREAEDFVYYDPQKENTMSLYQTLEEKPRFGTFLTKNSQGKMVLEMKGKDGEVEAFDPKELEEVLPYTASIQRMPSDGQKGDIRHYQFAKGSVKKNDLLVHISTGLIYKVTDLDTKSKTARQSKNGFFKLEGSFVTTDN